jgi:dienelactone hydrolase
VHKTASMQSSGARVTIEEYAPRTPGTGDGAVVLLYGSGGLESSAVPSAEEARGLARSGCRVYVPHYLDATRGRATDPESHYGLWAQTVRDAIEHVQLQTGIPQPRTAIVGYSLGGSVALVAAAQEPHLAGVVVWTGSLPDAYRNLRLLPPLLILHGGLDSIIPPYKRKANRRDLHKQPPQVRTQNVRRRGARIFRRRVSSCKSRDRRVSGFRLRPPRCKSRMTACSRARLRRFSPLRSRDHGSDFRLPPERAGRYFTTTLSTARLSLSSTTRTAMVCSAAGA